MTDQVRRGIEAWAKACVEQDWMNERDLWIRLKFWYLWKYKGIYMKWHDESEIAASIMGYIEKEEE